MTLNVHRSSVWSGDGQHNRAIVGIQTRTGFSPRPHCGHRQLLLEQGRQLDDAHPDLRALEQLDGRGGAGGPVQGRTLLLGQQRREL